ncbi:MAG TPA: glycosyltransferase family 4 protein [Candidatus Bilamarchaeum sp.]|nr:glycosyltransferase family 4 protein [Candidatus Bilamarchaeum sp.]
MDVVLAHPFLHQMGGGERVVLEIAKRFNPVIYCITYEREKTFSGFREFDVRVLPRHAAELPFFWLRGDRRRYNAVIGGFRYYFTKLREDYDVLNAHGCPAEWLANRNPRMVWYCHSPNRECFDLREWRQARMSLPKKIVSSGLCDIFKGVEFNVLPKIRHICTNSEVTNGRIKKYLKREDAEVIHPAVDTEKFACRSYEKFILYPSRIVPEKRFEFALEAFRLFSRKNPGFRLVIAGSSSDPAYLAKLKKDSAGLAVDFRPNPSDGELQGLYADCYATVFSAINEDWGLIPIESMASSKPCVSVNEGGVRYSIVDGKTGFLVASPEEMALKLSLLASDRNLVEKMGKAGRERVLENYTWKIFMDALEKKFREASR